MLTMLKGAIRNFSNVIVKNQNYFQTGFPKTDTSFGFIVSPKNARSCTQKIFYYRQEIKFTNVSAVRLRLCDSFTYS